jgi:hypothetical protein
MKKESRRNRKAEDAALRASNVRNLRFA